MPAIAAGSESSAGSEILSSTGRETSVPSSATLTSSVIFSTAVSADVASDAESPLFTSEVVSLAVTSDAESPDVTSVVVSLAVASPEVASPDVASPDVASEEDTEGVSSEVEVAGVSSGAATAAVVSAAASGTRMAVPVEQRQLHLPRDPELFEERMRGISTLESPTGVSAWPFMQRHLESEGLYDENSHAQFLRHAQNIASPDWSMVV
mmetsp:Transcript_55284/g.131315  ORF Transcript_55284/g.131315 Transcript_55284/m.131315 type:complete len:209 (-) Transcript_55284:698-1324(-)